MPKTDIELPNTSGKTDPTILTRSLSQQFERSEAARRQRAQAPVGKRSVASQMVSGYRALTGKR